jgi:tape measure domain-containing protein
MPKLSVKIEAVTRGLGAALKGASSKFKSFSSSIGNVASGLARTGSVVLAAAAAFTAFIVKAGQAAGQLKQTELAMATFLGSAEKAKQLIGDLRKFADVTPFDTNSVIQAGKVLAGAGVEASKTVDVIKMLGDISAGTGKDLGEMSQLYAKSMNKGKVQTRELLQLVNAGVPIIDKLAASMNRPKEAIFKMAEQGKIKFTDLKQVFKDMTSEGGIYAGLMEKQSRTLLGKWSTLQGKIQNLTADIGGPLQSSLISITDTFIDWTKQARNASGPIGLLIKDLQVVADLLASTREGRKFGGIKGATVETGWLDTLTDVADNLSTFKIGGKDISFSPAAMAAKALGFGSEAKGQAALEASGITEENTEKWLEQIAYNTTPIREDIDKGFE